MKFEVCIKFFDYWHCGSGSSGGKESDSLVAKYEQGSKKGLPYVPGKTLKGLVREMAEAQPGLNATDIVEWFGKEGGGNDGSLYVGNADIVEKIDTRNIPMLFKILRNTALDQGMAQKGSLRETEVVVPLSVEVVIDDFGIKENKKLPFKNAIRSVKRIGLSRNRGLGRCEVTVEEVAS